VSWQLASLAILAAVLLAGFVWYDRSRPPARVLALVAALAALAVVGRLAFAAFPNVKPTTDIVLFAGYALGGLPGFAVGAVTAIVSNVFFSQGPWTAWQMAGWGAVGVGGALLARAARGRELGRLPLAIACALAGLAFGAWMDVYQWTLGARQDLDSYLAVSASSLPYNVAHAAGNFAFCLVIGPAFIRALRRYRRRFEVRWEAPIRPGAAAAAAMVVALAVATGLSHVSPAATAAANAREPVAQAARASASARAARYLRRAQNRDGGFGAAHGQPSSQLFTGWAALGLAAAQQNPRDVHRGRGRAITTYLRRRIGALNDVGEIERTILVLRAAGLSPRRFAGRDLVARLLARRRSDGSFAGYVSYTAFGLLALQAAHVQPGTASADWLERSQNGDGGFGVARSSRSDADMTGAVLQALAAVGRGGGRIARRAARHLVSAQNGDGGFGQMAGTSSNSQSTAYAVQGLVAAHAGPGSVARAIRYLKRRQLPDGSIRYSRASSQTPVWVTAQALAALRRKPLPLGTVPRRVKPRSPARSPTPAAEAGPSGRGDSKGRSSSGGERDRGGERPAPETSGDFASRDSRDPSQVAPEPASGSAPPGESDGGPSALLVALAIAGALGAVGAVRYWLRRHRAASS
jgi:energy-coupling factor transport system substrate-specific component